MNPEPQLAGLARPGQAADMEFVEAGQEEDESAKGVQEGHH